jgi:cell division protein FtsB
MRYKDVDKQRERLEFEVDYLKKENMKLNAHIEEKLKLVENTELYGRLKAE